MAQIYNLQTILGLHYRRAFIVPVVKYYEMSPAACNPHPSWSRRTNRPILNVRGVPVVSKVELPLVDQLMTFVSIH